MKLPFSLPIRSVSACFPSRLTTLALASTSLFTAAANVATQGIPGYVIAPLSLMDRSNQATIRVTINGQRAMLIVDTGAPATLLDSRFYKGIVSKANDAKQNELPPELRKKIDAN